MAAPCEATCSRIISKSVSKLRRNSRTNTFRRISENHVSTSEQNDSPPTRRFNSTNRNPTFQDFIGAAITWNQTYGRPSAAKRWKNFNNNTNDNIQKLWGIWVHRRCYSCHMSRTCWNCQAREADKFFCPMCRVVQPPVKQMNYFDILGCNKRYDLGREELGNNYRELQRRLHPDKYAQSAEPERAYSSLQSVAINKAYSTLSKPLARGLYMLELAGFDIKESDLSTDPEFLSEIMELNEAVESADTLDDVLAVDRGNKARIEEIVMELTDAFDTGDFACARDLLARLQYYNNVDEKIEEKIPVQ